MAGTFYIKTARWYDDNVLMVRISRTGFTIVELLIVIVVIGILASITVVAFNGVQARASDARIRAQAKDVVKALHSWSITRGGALPTGSGYNSTATSGTGECTGGVGGHAGQGDYVCSLEQMLVDSKLLPADFITNLPPNKDHVSGPATFRTLFFYPCSSDSRRFVLFYYLERPTAEDTASLNEVIPTCVGTHVRDNYGMKGATSIHF